MSSGGFAILDVPPGTHPEPDEYIRAAMRWHFGEETGSTFWLSRKDSLGFDPVRDVRGIADLAKFPNVAEDLREVRAEDLIPRGYDGAAQVIGVFESGGTTGAPKRVVFLDDWVEREMAWQYARYTAYGIRPRMNWLAVAPTGPHMIGDYLGRIAARFGSISYTVDMDPRWVKRLLRDGKPEEAEAYTEHLVSQAAALLRSQDIAVLATTPPMLERLSRHDELVELINRKVEVILWAGAHLDADSRHLFRTEIFPGIGLYGLYGNTMTLGASPERLGRDDDLCVFDANSPFVSYSVVDPDTHEPVPYGERGQIVTNHVSKSALLPNNAERDEGIRIKPPAGSVGDSVADVTPLKSLVDAGAITVGVY
ncbi:phenazine antibiotic biosynthesis protein [Kribbella pittospori]|uniref:Phenazine antibiotic biosynthesis protein n=1 Tax=Kribbella pittospori TaxID=722689 RepID=A0A4R0JWD5_9ACTN|nr:AMP-binding protein [Kribbella pittospori]TCC49566.1 phenazine antibiotic biosynthesis protein [Kribbella pittospori]